MKETPIYQHRDLILDQCRQVVNGVILIIAPTGSGKTTGMRTMVNENKDVFGRTWMIQPTKMANNSLQKSVVKSITPIQALETYFRCSDLACDTLVIDEIHTRSVEYETILLILKKKMVHAKKRIILMTATADREYLESFFPEIRVMEVQVETPFPVEVEYFPMNQYHGFISHRGMIPMIQEALRRNPGHKRVLVFVYTHEQCDKLSSEMEQFARASGLDATRGLYGGMDGEEFEEWTRFLQTMPRFLVFATNVAETSLTIPGVSLVLDFGIRCVADDNRIVYDICPRANLIQRAGRTGRTCPGKVVRFMSETDFNERPFQDNPVYNYDLMVLRMLRHRFVAESVFPADVVGGIRAKFEEHRVISSDGLIDQHKATFVVSSPMTFKNSCMLYHHIQSHRNNTLFIVALSIIDAIESRMLRLYYYSPDLRMPRAKLMDFLCRSFANKRDELEMTLNLFFSCIMAEKPVEFSKAFSLNFRSVRQLRSHTNRVFSFLSEHLRYTKIDWMSEVRHNLLPIGRRGLVDKKIHDLSFVADESMEVVRQEFFKSPVAHVLTDQSLKYGSDDFHYNYYSCIIRPMSAHQPTGIIAFPTGRENEYEMCFSIYTQLPSRILRHIVNLSLHVRKEYAKRLLIRKKIQKYRCAFGHVMEDIREDVAYRPLAWKMMEEVKACMDMFTRLP